MKMSLDSCITLAVMRSLLDCICINCIYHRRLLSYWHSNLDSCNFIFWSQTVRYL